MKTRLPNQAPRAALLALIFAMAVVIPPVAGAANDENGVKPATVSPGSTMPPSWKDPNWKDPDKTLSSVLYDQWPLGEVARQLREQFNDAFDILIPERWQHPNNPSVSIDPPTLSIKMQLKNVTASEVFNAMNLVFEGENTPCRWELKMNGKRPTAVLRVIADLLSPVPDAPPPQPMKRLVYFVGDLVGDKKSGGMSMEQLVETVSQVYQMSYGPSKGVLQFHKETQLIIAHGTGDQIAFIQQTLSALRGRVQLEQRSAAKPAETKPKPDEKKE